MTVSEVSEAEHVRRTMRGMNLIRLEWIRRRLNESTVDYGALAAIIDLHAALAAADPAADLVLVDPRFSRWLGRLVSLIERRAPVLLPDGDFRATCRAAGAFAAAARYRSGVPEPTTVPVGADGRIELPGTGLSVVLGLRHAGTTVTVRADETGVEVCDRTGAPLAATVSREASPLPGILAPAGTELGDERAGPAVPGPTERVSKRWRAAWAGAGGRWRTNPDPGAVDVLPASGRLARVLDEFGCPNGIELNRLSSGRQRTDPTIDHLSLMSVREPDRYRMVAREIRSAPAGGARDLLAAHCSYIEADMPTAASAYATLLVCYPFDIDLWRDFTFALRHLGRHEPGEVWLFHTDEVIARATACAPDLAPLAVLVPKIPHDLAASADWRFLTGLLEWVGHDLDHR